VATHIITVAKSVSMLISLTAQIAARQKYQKTIASIEAMAAV
jgi:hypothetical protein